MYNMLCEKAKIWTNILKNSVLHKVGSKTTLSVLHKFVLFHLMENLPFDLPHTIYINMLRNLKGLGGLDNIYGSKTCIMSSMRWTMILITP